MRAPSFQFYPRQFSGDDAVQAMDLDATGAHILFLCAAAASAEGWRLPADERALRNRIHNPSQETWERIKVQLLAGVWKLSEDGGWWEQNGLRRTFEKHAEFSRQQAERSRRRWHPNAEPIPEACGPASVRDMPEACGPACVQTCSSSSTTKNKTKGKEKPLPFVLPGWVPEDTWERFVAHRREIHKPLTATGKLLLLGKLEKAFESGHDLAAMLDRSVENRWTGVFSPGGDARQQPAADPTPPKRFRADVAIATISQFSNWKLATVAERGSYLRENPEEWQYIHGEERLAIERWQADHPVEVAP